MKVALGCAFAVVLVCLAGCSGNDGAAPDNPSPTSRASVAPAPSLTPTPPIPSSTATPSTTAMPTATFTCTPSSPGGCEGQARICDVSRCACYCAPFTLTETPTPTPPLPATATRTCGSREPQTCAPGSGEVCSDQLCHQDCWCVTFTPTPSPMQECAPTPTEIPDVVCDGACSAPCVLSGRRGVCRTIDDQCICDTEGPTPTPKTPCVPLDTSTATATPTPSVPLPPTVTPGDLCNPLCGPGEHCRANFGGFILDGVCTNGCGCFVEGPPTSTATATPVCEGTCTPTPTPELSADGCAPTCDTRRCGRVPFQCPLTGKIVFGHCTGEPSSGFCGCVPDC
jgi:hypothetical protein